MGVAKCYAPGGETPKSRLAHIRSIKDPTLLEVNQKYLLFDYPFKGFSSPLGLSVFLTFSLMTIAFNFSKWRTYKHSFFSCLIMQQFLLLISHTLLINFKGINNPSKFAANYKKPNYLTLSISFQMDN